MKNLMSEVFKALKTLLTGAVTINGTEVPYYVSTFTDASTGIYISGYSESDNSTKHYFGANLDVTLSCFCDTTPDDCQSISAQVEAIIKPNISSAIDLNTNKVTVQMRAGKVHTVPLIDGKEVNQIEITYSFIIN
jgi:hypothetical protein